MTPWREVLDVAFGAALVAIALLHVLVYAAPLALVRFNALPWAFRVGLNTDLEFQTVTYAAVHQSWQARWSHMTLPLEYVAWATLLWIWHPVAVALATAGVVVVHSRLAERAFAVLAGVVALALALLAGALVHTLGADRLLVPIKVLLLVGPALRFVGHSFDPIPPWIGAERDAFLPFRQARMGWRLPLVAVAGWVSECAASLPFRLFWVQLFWVAQRLGYRPRRVCSWAEAVALGEKIRALGWAAFPKAGRLFEPMRVRS